MGAKSDAVGEGGGLSEGDEHTQKLWDVVQKIRHHRRLYEQGKPEISDAEYDALEDTLRAWDASHPVLSEVGYDQDGKLVHHVPMLSLEKTRKYPRVRFWAQKLQSLISTSSFSPPDVELVCSFKLDGVSLALEYRHERLYYAKTRGDGHRGEDVTAKVEYVSHIPRRGLHFPSTAQEMPGVSTAVIEVRGELCCGREGFAALCAEMKRRGLSQPSSRRNIVAGLLARKDHEDLTRYLSFYAFDVVNLRLGEGHLFATETEKWEYLSAAGFFLAPSSVGTEGVERVEAKRVVRPHSLRISRSLELEIIYSQGQLESVSFGKGRRKSVWSRAVCEGVFKGPGGGIPFTLVSSECMETMKVNAELEGKEGEFEYEELQEVMAQVLDLFVRVGTEGEGEWQDRWTAEDEGLWARLRWGAYEVEDLTDQMLFVRDHQKCEWLQRQGFVVSRMYEAFSAYVSAVQQQSQDPDRDVDIDGLVFTHQQCEVHEQSGYTAHHPLYKLSYKWQGEEVQSRLIKVEWEVSRSGTITPVAIIEPAVVGGSTIQRVTLYHKKYFLNLAPSSGDTVYVIRAGGVIPRITRIVPAASGARTGDGESSLPEVCPACGHPLDLQLSETHLICTNTGSCPPQVVGRIDHWCGSVGIYDLSKKRIASLLEAGLVTDISDLYRLVYREDESEYARRREILLAMEGVGEKMAQKIWDGIERAKRLELEEFLVGLGIPGLQKSTAQLLVKHYPRLHRIRHLTVDELVAVEGFAEKTAATLVEGFAAKSSIMEELFRLGVTVIDPR